MEEIVKSFALMGGAIAVIVPAVSALINHSRLLRADGDHFVVQVGDRRFVFDVTTFADADIRSIDDATNAVKESAEAHG